MVVNPRVAVITRMRIWFALSICMLALPALALEVVRVTPEGDEVPAGHQIVLEFDEDASPLGAMQASDEQLAHLRVEPALDCQWRWLDLRTLACQLDEAGAMRPATRYSVRVERGFPGLEGATTRRGYVARFATTRPQLQYAFFERWAGLGLPVVRLTFNQPVAAEAVTRVLRFSDTQAAVEAWEHDWQQALMVDGVEARTTWVATPVQALKQDQAVRLHFTAGLRTVLGPLPGLAHESALALHTHPSLRFFGLGCYNVEGEIRVAAGQSQSVPCDPDAGMALLFTAPVPVAPTVAALQVEPRLPASRWQGEPPLLQMAHTDGQLYAVRWYGQLEPNASYSFRLNANVEDAFGRSLELPGEAVLQTGSRRPLVALPHTQAVLEAGVDSELPVHVRNVEQVTARYRSVDAGGVRERQTHEVKVPDAPEQDLSLPLGVRSMVNGSGIVAGEIGSVPDLGLAEYERRFTVQITPYQVHLKLGHFRSLAWVTDLASGEAVAGAQVSLFRGTLDTIAAVPDTARTYVTDAQGLARLPGTADIDPQLAAVGWRCDAPCARWLLRVDGDRGMAALPVDYPYQMNLWRASRDQLYLNQNQRHGHARAWGTTGQGVYRPGETVRYKVYLRDQLNDRWTAPPFAAYELTVTDPQGRVVFTRSDVRLSEFGATHGEIAIGKNSAMGWYRVALSSDVLPGPLDAFEFLVTEFEPSPFKVATATNGDRFAPDAQLLVRTTASLHGGGAYTDAATRTVVRLQPRAIQFDSPLTQGYQFDSGTRWQSHEVAREAGVLNADGAAEVAVTLADVPEDIVYADLLVESTVQDDRGKSVASRATARYQAVDRFVGVKPRAWMFETGARASVDVLVVDDAGRAQPGESVQVTFERLQRRAAKVRGAGNTYLTETVEEWLPVGRCEITSSDAAQSCSFVPDHAGSYRAVAQMDGHTTRLGLWVRGEGHVVWEDDQQAGVELVPEARSYAVGDTARVLVKNPLPGALALITVERYGVHRAWVQRLEGSTPVIEVPVVEGDAPGMYLSVALMSPRIEAPPPGNSQGGQRLDLGKPAFRLGYVPLTVVDDARRLPVEVAPAQSTYKPREEAVVHFSAPAGTELAVVVLDEAVLDLIRGGTEYFDPVSGFDGLHGVDVDNYSLMARLVGRTLFESKGASQGGDGGTSLSVRSLIDYVAHWQPSLPVGADGKATLRFSLPDNLTGWRVLAMAVDAGQRFGFGEGRFTSHLDTEIRPAMPNQVGEGDSFSAAFTVSNRTDRARTLRVDGAVQGDVLPTAALEQTLVLPPHGREVVRFAVRAASVTAPGSMRFTVSAGDAQSSDALLHALPVLPRRTAEVATVYGVLGESSAPVQLPLRLGVPAHDDIGGLSVAVSGSLLGQLDGAFAYMRDYPYTCWEQKLSKAAMARLHQRLSPYLSNAAAWPESSSLPGDVLRQLADYQAPNGGMAYFLGDDRYVSPYLSAYTALLLPLLRGEPASAMDESERRLHAYLASLLKEDDFGVGFDATARLSVRAMAVHALALAGQAHRRDLTRLLEQDVAPDSFALANLLQAAQLLGDDDAAANLDERLRARTHRSSGSIVLHGSDVRDQCAVLSATAGAGDDAHAARLARAVGALRNRDGAWGNTQENLFCARALSDYATRYESVAPNFSVRVKLDDDSLGTLQVDGLAGAAQTSAPVTSLSADRAAQLSLTREGGSGTAYFDASVRFAPLQPSSEAINSGFAVERVYEVQRNGDWQALAPDTRVQRGDLIRVLLRVNTPVQRAFVVVNDPVPGGLEPLNADLATASTEDIRAEPRSSAFYHSEIGHRTVRFYAEQVPAGAHALSYTAQVIADGTFSAPAARAEAMYTPDIYGASAPRTLLVAP